MQDDVTALKAWLSQYSDRTILVSHITKQLLLHPTDATREVEDALDAEHSGDFSRCGKDVADLVVLTMGTVHAERQVEFDLKAIPEVVAGFIFGMVGENHLTEMETCYTSTQPLVTYAENFVKEIESLDFIKAIETLEAFVYHFQLDVQPCKNMQDDIAAIEGWAAQFKDPAALAEKVAKHYLLHKKAIQADIAQEKLDWANGQYFLAGQEIADIAIQAIGPIETDWEEVMAIFQ